MKTRWTILVPALACGPLTAATPLDPPRLKDMILVGEEGASRSTVTRRLLYREGFLYASGEPGLQTIDARDPYDLRLADDWTHSSPKMNGSDSAGDILYVANWSPGEGLVLFDLADPAHPAHLRTLSTAAHTWEVDIQAGILYVAIDDGIITGIDSYDIADPRKPAFLHFLSTGDRLVGNAARHGPYLYFTHKSWLRVFDVSSPWSPRFIREIELGGLGGETRVRGSFLFVLCREIVAGEQGGVRVYALDDPASPRAVEFWEQSEPRDMHFQGDLLVIPASGSGLYILDAKDPLDLKQVSHWYVSWPGMGHGGYPITAVGEGTHVFIGTTGGNNPECEDFEACSYYGARVYSAQIVAEPPRIAPVTPDPDTAFTGREYLKRLVLLEGDPLPVWSVVRGPPGLAVDAQGLVRGWTPGPSDEGEVFTVEIRASNLDGSARVSFGVQVEAAPEDLLAWFPFEAGDEGWALSAWKSGPYDPGTMEWGPEGGNPGGGIRAAGSGATNNLDTCNREGGSMIRTISTEGRIGIRIEFEVCASLDSPPGSSGTGSCQVLDGTSEDKLVVSFSTKGASGPWIRALSLSEGAGLPPDWTREVVDLSAVKAADDNPLFAVRFQWQFNTAGDQGRIDNVKILGTPRGPDFRRGDANGDLALDLSDGIAILFSIFAGGELPCEDAGDADDDGQLDLTDVVLLLGYLFLGGLPPEDPFPEMGFDATLDSLGCAGYPSGGSSPP